MKNITKWISQGELNQEISENIVYSNSGIDSFLKQDRIFILVAPKGMGKTLLLRCKRQLLVERNNNGAIFIPQNSMLDLPRLSHQVGEMKYKQQYEDDVFWKELWEISILLSIFLHNDSENTWKDIIFEQENIPHQIRELFNPKTNKRIQHPSRNPSEILFLILQQTIRNMMLLRDSLAFLKKIYVTINTPTFCFIDSFDQALRDYTREQPNIWSAAQIGLMLASWNLNRSNAHVKVYIAVRQEAYSHYMGENRMTMQSSILQIKYSKSDLKNLFGKLFNYYEKINNFEEYLGFDTFENHLSNSKENVFDYIYRHIIKTPRAIIIIGNRISYILNELKHNDKYSKRMLQKTVIETSYEIVKNYFLGEMTPFLYALNSSNKIAYFLSLFNTNIVTKEQLEHIKENFTCRYPESIKSSPIDEIINIGLLGFLKTNIDEEATKIKFKKITDIQLQDNIITPESELFFIHPSLHEYISSINYKYRITKGITVGDDVIFKDEHLDKILPEYNELNSLIEAINLSKNSTIEALSEAEKARKTTLDLLRTASEGFSSGL